jgi:orotate phosphoribosyltransferase-like protein
MKKKRFRVEQIIGVLKQAQVGVPAASALSSYLFDTNLFPCML